MKCELVYGLPKKLAKELYRKMHPTTPIEQLEADIVERGCNW